MDEPSTPPRDSARQRALRIPLDYHRTRGPLWAWRLGITLACFVAGGIYIAWVLAGGKPAASQMSTGVLARDHARWDSDCKACHAPFVPQRPDAGGARLLSLSLTNDTANDAHHQADAKCSECHKSAGAHQPNQIAAEVESCASCHRDHQGREFHMARMDDAHCTSCHASIAGHRTSQGSQGKSPLVNVTSFELPSADSSSGHGSSRPTRYGRSWTHETMRTRHRPWTVSWMLPATGPWVRTTRARTAGRGSGANTGCPGSCPGAPTNASSDCAAGTKGTAPLRCAVESRRTTVAWGRTALSVSGRTGALPGKLVRGPQAAA